MMPDIPIKPEINLEFTRSREEHVYDHKVFPLCANKIEDIGILKPKKYVIRSDWNGKINFQRLRDPMDTIRELGKLRDDGYITEEEFQIKKKELLERI